MEPSPSESVALRPTAESDLDFVTAIECEAAADRFVEAWDRSEHALALTEPAQRHLIVESAESGAPIGFVLPAGIGSPHGAVEFRRVVIASKGRDFGRQAVRLTKKYVFDELGAHRLWLDVKNFNHRA